VAQLARAKVFAFIDYDNAHDARPLKWEYRDDELRAAA